MAACTGLASSKNEEMIASFHGFNLSAYFESFSQKFILTIRRRCSYPMEMGSDPSGNIQRLINLMAGIKKNLSEAKQKLESVKQQFATAQKEVLKPFAKEEEPISEANRMQQGEPNRKDEKAEIPRRESETVKVFDGTITDSDENNRIPVEAKEHMPKSQMIYHEHRLLTLNDLKQIQREYAERRMARQNLNRQNSVKRDGYSR